jgi:uncharacterized protein with NAD-binding domain and iron-sulfur cluster
MSQGETATESNLQGTGAQQQARTRLAVLGGGPSALTALYHITDDPVRRTQYDITVYQMGWRLGGKGASGRTEDGKILEHGLHVLFGFYENFFAMMRGAYKELGRPSSEPIATWKDAFHGADYGVVMDFFEGEWRRWDVEFPTNNSQPGDGHTFDTAQDYFSMLGQLLLELILGWRALRSHQDTSSLKLPRVRQKEKHKDKFSDYLINGLMRGLEWPLKRALASKHSEKRRKRIRTFSGLFQKILWRFSSHWAESSIESRRFWLGVDFTLAIIRGIYDDQVFSKGGFNRIDDLDFRDWLRKHGASEDTVQSPYGRTVYDAAFSYKNGDPNDQQVAAGAALRCFLRFGLTYKGHAYYKMSAGMGDIVFGPLYEVLKKRGVKFEFFHKVDELRTSDMPDANGEPYISSVKMTRQARLKPGVNNYEPLVDIKGLPCWPAHPLYDQLEEADVLRHHDLESYYDQPPPEKTDSVVLKAGEDYDKILYAIPIGAAPYVCKELVKENKRWADMVQHVQSIATISLQLWFERDLAGLGWGDPSPLLSLYVQPINTWADMSQVKDREHWPPALEPENISYFCGAMKGPDFAPDPGVHFNFETEQYALARDYSVDFCEKSLVKLIPAAADPNRPLALDWNLLVDLNNGQGEARMDSQYWRSNCGPTERCTIALPGATQYRMKAGDTGYANLSITGDWIDNDFYVACMEGTVMAGIHGARAVTGVNFPIVGETFNNS